MMCFFSHSFVLALFPFVNEPVPVPDRSRFVHFPNLSIMDVKRSENNRARVRARVRSRRQELVEQQNRQESRLLQQYTDSMNFFLFCYRGFHYNPINLRVANLSREE
jgi:hypothetical protein